MKILIVEDEIGISNFLSQGLQEEGFTVDVANQGDLGLQKALTEKYDLILLDWMLPKLSGLEICLKIREQNKVVPILFLTAKDTVQETIEALQSGANDYIKKPFSFEELLERIKVHFRTATHSEVLSLGTIKIDLGKRKVFQNDSEVIFTQKEFDLLAYLVKNKGTICSRNKIIEDVWDIHFEYDSGVIDVFMNAIRKKLNLTPDVPLIKTIRGVGYIAEDNHE
ncbi:DNA-binding response OmpR family regulator [Flavobacterium croceum DSM 17960]|uniref:DNA-binding response OmpR family regulator n=1 Tax=Flavobacterium croceum DSM 17960 TaxID=1121886 RepID=A0A2S4N5Y1_9FLAO|nr:response regulator transcription factor [Flavobacterium croceum]POS01132.1 DNA-binding response OmpR family regulator [Flavobacterium croceum DSM 17960]